jgi:GTPase SAR1 family protein
MARGTGASDATSFTQTASPIPQTVHHATARIVLVGDSGVGKTGLGWRLAHGEYREHDSSHGQQFWVLGQLAKTRKDGTHCEAVLWDLAGQPDYRLIHALSIQDADLALILFDPTNNRDPLGSAEYWLRQLPPACPKILVAARVDRGHPVLTKEELEAFCKREGIAGGWIATSAREGTGLEELLERMRNAIAWDDKPAVSTDAIFKSIKDFVLGLKESRTRRQIIYTVAELREALARRSRPRQRPTDDQVLTAVRHLGSQGFLRLLTLSTGEERILLVPELLNNLASSIVLEARRNPRGLGAVEERRLFDNSYRFRELESLSREDQALLLDGTITAFLANRLSYRCFRESWGDLNLLVFPDLMNLKKPERNDLVTEDGPSYVIAGATENTFARLVVLLGYTNLFLRTDQAHDVAWFESDPNDLCGVRQIRDDNDRTLVLLFSPNVKAPVRAVFEGLVEQMLNRGEVSVRRLRPVKCSRCGTSVDRAVMARRLKSGKAVVHCEECGNPVVLPPDEPLSVKPSERVRIAHEEAVAEVRTTFEEVIYELLRFAQAEKWKAPTCFVSYAWGNAEHERWVERRLALDLEKAGIPVVLDRWDNAHPGASIPRFVDRIEKADRVLVVGTRAYRRKYENKDEKTGTVVAAEMDLISARLLGTEAEKATVIPLLLEGEPGESLPPALRSRVRCDYRNNDRYFDTTLDLLLSLYGVDRRHPAVTHWKEQLAGAEEARPSLKGDADDGEEAPDEATMKQALGQVGRHAMSAAFAAGKPVVVEHEGQLVWLYPDGTRRPYEAAPGPASGATP